MKPDASYLAVESRHPLRGINSAVPSTQLDPSYSPRLSNMFIRDGEAFKRSGYYEFVDQDLNGDVMALVDFQLLDNTRKLVAITSTRQYEFDNGTDTWLDITADQDSHAITAANNTTDKITIYGDHVARFAASSNVTIENSTANDGTFDVIGSALVGTTTEIELDTADVIDETADGQLIGPTYTITAASVGSKTFTVTGNFSGLFTVGVKIFVTGSTANDGEYTVASSTGTPTVITVDEAPTDGTGDGLVTVMSVLTAITGDFVDWTVGTDNDTHRLYVTNGRDRPLVYDGADRFREWYPKYTGFTTCRTLEVFFSLLVMGHVTLTAAEPKLVAWSDTTEFDDFEGGDSGVLLIPKIDGLIQRLIALGDRLIIYSDNTIAALLFIGGSIVMASEVLLQGIRLVSARGIVSLGSAHVFASQENIYFFDGTRGIRGVGDTIRPTYKQAITLENAANLFAFNDVAKRTIWVVVPTSSTTSTVFTLDYDIYDLRAFKWTQSTFADRPFTLGFFKRIDGPIWTDPPPNTWTQESGRWVEEGERVDFPVRIMGSGSKVYLMDDSSGLDDTASVTASYETADFVVPQIDQSVFGRWGEIEADLVGNEVKVYYSTDQGGLWTLASTETLTGDWTAYRVPIDVSSRTLRVKFESTIYFSLRWIRAWVRVGGPR